MSCAKADAEGQHIKPDDGSSTSATVAIAYDARQERLGPETRRDKVLKTKSAERSRASSVRYLQYDQRKEDEYLTAIRQLISKDLSEPYSIYVYRYFMYQWGHLCFMTMCVATICILLAITADIPISRTLPWIQAVDSCSALIGVVISKLERHRSGTYRGYIAMLAVEEAYRGQGIATQLVCMAIESMKARSADEVVLETEVTNTASLRLYERLGFLRSKRLHRYYLNGNTAFRLVLCLKAPVVKE